MSYRHIPGEDIPPEDSASGERIAVDLNARWYYLIFIWMIIYCTVLENWCKIVITINCNQMVLESIYQEKARQLFSFLKDRVPMEVVNHCGPAFSLTLDI